MKVTITDFAKMRKLDRNTINTWIRRHPEIEAVCEIEGRDRVIDTESEEYRILEAQYPYLGDGVEDTVPASKYAQVLESLRTAELILDYLGVPKTKEGKYLVDDKNVPMLIDSTAQEELTGVRTELEETKQKLREEEEARRQAETDKKVADARAEERADAIAKAEKLLEEEKGKVEKAEKENEELQSSLDTTIKEKETILQEQEELEKQIEKMKNASFWQRIRGWK